jgi:UDP-N-acetylglucosamine diphosphorylase / glucose-1-phosphate thymidylyltransferase / UDP-N-acetylgalactosamine diphosphorylase / glucosamine-1-phosphate N-acetyltransferase / galactosamine-1-phosphate N-acetyltransferase
MSALLEHRQLLLVLLYNKNSLKSKLLKERAERVHFCYTSEHMQCVILAAGKGTRLRPLTDNCPKPLVKVAGKTLLDHIVGSLPSAVDEIILVTGYLEEQIHSHCGDVFHGRKVTYVHQAEQKGTGHALWLCKDFLKGRFLFMFADDLHGANDIARATSYTRSMLTLTTNTPERFGIVVRHPDGTLAEFIEKPEHPPSNLASTGVMVLDDNLFKYELTKETNGEYYLTDIIAEYAKDYPIAVVEQQLWIPIGYPEDITRAEMILESRK